MFEFTTLTIYNFIKVVTPDTIKSGNAGKYNVIKKSSNETPEIRIGNTRFNHDTVLSVQKKLHTPESLASVTFDLGDLQTIITGGQDTIEGNYRIVLYLGLSMNSQDSFYANALVYKGKPLYIEFPVYASDEDNMDKVAARIKKIADKYMLFMAQRKFLNVTVENDEITFEGVNGYQQITKAILQRYHEEPCGGCNPEGFEDIILGVPAAWKINTGTGKAELTKADGEKIGADGELVSLEDNEVPILPSLEAFCDYDWIIHNLRLPTLTNTYFWSANKSELPVVGGEYVQYCIKMCQEAEHIGGEVVGHIAKSATNHIFYVLDQGNNVSDFEAALAYAGLSTILTDADDVLKTPYAGVPAASANSGSNDPGTTTPGVGG